MLRSARRCPNRRSRRPENETVSPHVLANVLMAAIDDLQTALVADADRPHYLRAAFDPLETYWRKAISPNLPALGFTGAYADIAKAHYLIQICAGTVGDDDAEIIGEAIQYLSDALEHMQAVTRRS